MQDTCDDREGGGKEPGHRFDARIRFTSMFEFAACGRRVERAVAVGSVPPELASIWEKLGRVGMIVDLQERGAQSGREQGVDQALQLEMMNSLVDRERPAIAVLLTGDGGYRPYCDRLLKKGWGVEVLCFSKGFSPKLQQIARSSGGRGKYIKLDNWYRQLTYLQAPDGTIIRHADPLDLRGRVKV
jgi:hypothetical protein